MVYFVKFLSLVAFIVVISLVPIVHAQDIVTEESNKNKPLPSYLQYKSYTNVRTDYSVSHRTQDEIMNWINMRLASIMTFDAQNVDEHFKEIKVNFIKTGWNEFIKYIDSEKVREEVVNNGYALISIIEGRGFIKREGPMSNIYRWVVDIPVLMSFYQLDKNGKIEPDISSSTQISILLTITRVTKGGGADKIAISGWKVIKRGRNIEHKRNFKPLNFGK